MTGAGTVCRTCLGSQALAPLFPEPAQYRSFQLALRLCTGLQCSYDDGLPLFLCETCQQLLKAFMLFRFQSKTADQWLKQHYKNPIANFTKTSSEGQLAPIVKLENIPTTAELKLEAEIKLAEFYKNNTSNVPEIRLFVDTADRINVDDNLITEECQLHNVKLIAKQEIPLDKYELKVVKSKDKNLNDHDYVKPTRSSDPGELYVEVDTENYHNLLQNNKEHTAESKPMVKYSDEVEQEEVSEDSDESFLNSTAELEYSLGNVIKEHEKEVKPTDKELYIIPPKAIKRQLTITPNITCAQSMIVIDCLQPNEINEKKKVKPRTLQNSMRNPNLTSRMSKAYNELMKNTNNTIKKLNNAHKNVNMESFCNTSHNRLARYLAWKNMVEPEERPKKARKPEEKSCETINDKDTKVVHKLKLKTPVNGIAETRETKSSNEFRRRAWELIAGPFDRRSTHVECKVCKVVCKSLHSFQSHAQIHLGFKHLCEFCAKGLQSRAALKLHLQYMHGLEKELACSYCDYKAAARGEIKVHELKEHMKERPFVCDQCGAAFFSKRCVTQHIRTAHREGRPYKCDECPRRFKLSSQCTHHMKMAHHPPFKFLCHICNNTYTKTLHVRKHLVKIHKIPREQQVVKVHRLYFQKPPFHDLDKQPEHWHYQQPVKTSVLTDVSEPERNFVMDCGF